MESSGNQEAVENSVQPSAVMRSNETDATEGENHQQLAGEPPVTGSAEQGVAENALRVPARQLPATEPRSRYATAITPSQWEVRRVLQIPSNPMVEIWTVPLHYDGRSIYGYCQINGRCYHRLRDNSVYFTPIDELEKDRMDMQHHAFVLASEGKLYFAPIPSPRRVLDLGTGTGIWPIELGQRMPGIELLVGTDLSVMQPIRTPIPRLAIHLHDVEAQWTLPPIQFDFVHARFLLSRGIRNRANFFRQCFRQTTPGGWLEVQEMEMNIRSDQYVIAHNSALRIWSSEMLYGMIRLGRPIQLDWTEILALMAEAGFIDIQMKLVKIPIGPWERDRRLKRAGMIHLASLLQGMDGMSRCTLSYCGRWETHQLDRLLSAAKNELMQRGAHFYVMGASFFGRKPVLPATR